jgi:hypothetical protein
MYQNKKKLLQNPHLPVFWSGITHNWREFTRATGVGPLPLPTKNNHNP